MRISDWSSDVCSSDLRVGVDNLVPALVVETPSPDRAFDLSEELVGWVGVKGVMGFGVEVPTGVVTNFSGLVESEALENFAWQIDDRHIEHIVIAIISHDIRSEDHNSELHSQIRLLFSVFCSKNQKQ